MAIGDDRGLEKEGKELWWEMGNLGLNGETNWGALGALEMGTSVNGE